MKDQLVYLMKRTETEISYMMLINHHQCSNYVCIKLQCEEVLLVLKVFQIMQRLWPPLLIVSNLLLQNYVRATVLACGQV